MLQDTLVTEQGRRQQIHLLAILRFGFQLGRRNDHGIVLVEHLPSIEVSERNSWQPGLVVEIGSDGTVEIRVLDSHGLSNRGGSNDDRLAINLGDGRMPDLVFPGQSEMLERFSRSRNRRFHKGVWILPRGAFHPFAANHQTAPGTSLLESHSHRVTLDFVRLIDGSDVGKVDTIILS